ncbi:MAG: alpha/beta fold hydrolase [Clostridia bacterium]|nr:alpha/beta fold hydrolase [Clostridia bacterium]
MPPLVIALIVLGVFLILLIPTLCASIYAYRRTFYMPKKRVDNSHDVPSSPRYSEIREKMLTLVDELMALPYEEIYIKSFDGLMLFGRYYHTKDGAPLQIQMHGYRGNAYRDFCGGHKLAKDMGHNILLIDQRGHGKSEGKTTTFGLNESRDALSWASYAYERFGNIPTFLVGISMGGACVLTASSLQLPKSVVGIIADCPFSKPKKIIKKVCVDLRLNAPLIYPFIRLGALLFGHFNLERSSAQEAVENTSLPVLLMHGADDIFVPCYMSEEIYNHCNSIKFLYTFDGADHGLSYFADTEKYERASCDFISLCIAGKAC